MTDILVSGCSGFLASYLIPDLIKRGYKVNGISDQADFISHGYDSCFVDIRDMGAVHAVIDKNSPEIILHLAALSNVGYSWREPRLTMDVNLIGSQNIMEAIRLSGLTSRLILMSSAEIYGKSETPIREDGAQGPRNFYALSKQMMEQLALFYTQAYRLNVTILRGFNFTGPGQAEVFVASDFARQIALIESGKQAARIRVGNLEAVRDFSDVRDISSYIGAIIDQNTSHSIVNLCSGRAVKIRDILDILLGFSERKIAVEVDPEKFRPLENPFLIGDPGFLKSRFGLQPAFTLEQTLIDILNFWRAIVTESCNR